MDFDLVALVIQVMEDDPEQKMIYIYFVELLDWILQDSTLPIHEVFERIAEDGEFRLKEEPEACVAALFDLRLYLLEDNTNTPPSKPGLIVLP